MFFTPTGSGSCEITSVMPLAHGMAVMNAVDTLAGDDRFETADGCVTKGQRRVAALVALTLGDPGSIGRVDGPVGEAKIKLDVSVVVPLATTIGRSEQGGRVGIEPVDADLVRDLIMDCDPASTIRRLVTDEAGAVLDAGRARYAISDVQRRVIALRDGVCRFPGCTKPAERCEVDHAREWDSGGHTSMPNLGPLCKHHHQAKTHGRWRITQSRRNGRCTWTSPLGRVYEHEPPDLLPPLSRVIVSSEPPPF